MPKLKKKRSKPKARKVAKIKPAKRRKVLAKKTKSVGRKAKKTFEKKAVVQKKIKAKKNAKRPVSKKPKKKALKAKRVKIIILRRKKKQAVESPKEGFSAESLFKAKIKVIGIGGGGGSIVSEIGRSLEKATFVIADTDIRALKKKSGIKYFWFGQDLTHGLGTGVNIELARQAAESAKEKISEFFKDQDIVIFVASLGGGLGSGATQVFADAAREFGGITFGIFTMPFKFEGKNKQRIAQNALKSLRESLNVSLVIPNEKIFKVIDSSTPITNAFSTVNKSLIESLESLIDLIYNPGIINIDFADVRTILKGIGNSAFLNTVEESGKDKIEKICDKIFKNPLLQNNSFLAERILFNIAGSESLSMFEVQKISSHIASLNPKAKIIFGISKNSKLKNKIKTTILMTGGRADGQIKDEGPAEHQAKKIEELPEKEAATPKKEKSRKSKNKPKKPSDKPKHEAEEKTKGKTPAVKEEKSVSFIPVFEVPAQPVNALGQKMDIIQTELESGKKTIRRSGLEIKKAEELQEKKRMAQEKEWETPAFLRRIKFKS